MVFAGVLKLEPGQAGGTVALLDREGGTVLQIVRAGEDGRFEIPAPEPLPPGAALFGVPDEALDAAAMLEVWRTRAGALYEAEVSATEERPSRHYLNAASTCIAALRRADLTLDAAAAERRAKRHLFGAAVASRSPGYTAGFLAQIVSPRVFSAAKLVETAADAGGIARWAAALSDETAAPTAPPFGGESDGPAEGGLEAVRAETAEESMDETSDLPSIPDAANWAMNDPMWRGFLEAQQGDYRRLAVATNKQSEFANGLAAGVNNEMSFSAGGWLSDKIAGAAVAWATSYGLNMLFGLHGSSSEEAEESLLQSIAGKLAELVAMQQEMLTDLNEIISEVLQGQEQALAETLDDAVGEIQRLAQRMHDMLAHPARANTGDIEGLVNDILDPSSDGIASALDAIDQGMRGSPLVPSLPELVWRVLQSQTTPAGQVATFFSNETMFTPAQGIFHYYRGTQTVGVLLLIQAHNFRHAKESGDLDAGTAYTPSPQAKRCHDQVMIGSASGHSSKLERQRDDFRAAFWPAYGMVQGYLGDIPDDLAVCLLPEVDNQLEVNGHRVQVYSNPATGLLVLGLMSAKLRNWTGVPIALGFNNERVGHWVLPTQFAWRFPGCDEFTVLLNPAVGQPVYHGKLFDYFSDQGFLNDGTDYSQSYRFTALLSRDSAGGELWWDQQRWIVSPEQYPIDIHGQPGEPYPRPAFIRGFAGHFPLGYSAYGGTPSFSSKGYNVLDPNDPNYSWRSLPWFDVSGGVIVADPYRSYYVPWGGYLNSCVFQSIRVTLTCTHKTGQSLSCILTECDSPNLGNVDPTQSTGAQLIEKIGTLTNRFCPGLRVSENGSELELVPEYGPVPGPCFVPAGSYLESCTDIRVTLDCRLVRNNGSSVERSVDLTPFYMPALYLDNHDGEFAGTSPIPPPAAPGSAISVAGSGDQPFVHYLTPGGDVIELHRRTPPHAPGGAVPGPGFGGWFGRNVTAQAGCPKARFGSQLVAGAGSVFFLDIHGHVYDAQGADDLTARLGAPPAASASPLTGDGDSALYYLDDAGHVHQFAKSGGNWAHHSLSEQAGASAVAPGSPLASVENEDGQFVAYRNASGFLASLTNSGAGWTHHVFGGFSLAPGSSLSYSNHTVFYVNPTGSLIQVSVGRNNRFLGFTDITAQLSASFRAPVPTTSLTSYNGSSVFYLSDGGWVNQFAFGAGWTYNDLSSWAAAPLAAVPPPSSLSGLASQPDPQQVFFADAAGTLYQLKYESGQWRHVNLFGGLNWLG
jgi:hypothetical protein